MYHSERSHVYIYTHILVLSLGLTLFRTPFLVCHLVLLYQVGEAQAETREPLGVAGSVPAQGRGVDLDGL